MVLWTVLVILMVLAMVPEIHWGSLMVLVILWVRRMGHVKTMVAEMVLVTE